EQQWHRRYSWADGDGGVRGRVGERGCRREHHYIGGHGQREPAGAPLRVPDRPGDRELLDAAGGRGDDADRRECEPRVPSVPAVNCGRAFRSREEPRLRPVQGLGRGDAGGDERGGQDAIDRGERAPAPRAVARSTSRLRAVETGSGPALRSTTTT